MPPEEDGIALGPPCAGCARYVRFCWGWQGGGAAIELSKTKNERAMERYRNGVFACGIFAGILFSILIYLFLKNPVQLGEGVITAFLGALVGGALSFFAAYFIYKQQEYAKSKSAVELFEVKVSFYGVAFKEIFSASLAMHQFCKDRNGNALGIIEAFYPYKPISDELILEALEFVSVERKHALISLMGKAELYFHTFEYVKTAFIKAFEQAGIDLSSLHLPGQYTVNDVERFDKALKVIEPQILNLMQKINNFLSELEAIRQDVKDNFERETGGPIEVWGRKG